MSKISLRSLNKRALSFVFALGFACMPIICSHADENKHIPTHQEEHGSMIRDYFYIGYPKNFTKTHLLERNILVKAMEKVNILPYYIPYNNNPQYTVILDKRTCIYLPESNTFTCNGKSIKCRFYATNNNLDEIDNIIVVIGGTGSRNRGEDLSNMPLASNSIIAVCYSGNSEINMIDCSETVADFTRFADYLFLKNKGQICNSIVGTSEGAQTAFITVANNPGLYQTLVCSNGSAYWNKGKSSLIKNYSNANGYNSFRNMEIIFLESKNNNYWNPSIIQTIIDLRENGVSMSDVSFYTNDVEFTNNVKAMLNKGNFYFLSSEEACKYGNWSRHGDGMKMIIDSNILCYLSDSYHTNLYASNYNYSVENYNIGRK